MNSTTTMDQFHAAAEAVSKTIGEDFIQFYVEAKKWGGADNNTRIIFNVCFYCKSGNHAGESRVSFSDAINNAIQKHKEATQPEQNVTL